MQEKISSDDTCPEIVTRQIGNTGASFFVILNDDRYI